MLKKVINRGIKVSLVIAMLAIAAVMTTPARAEEDDIPPPMFGDVVIGRRLSPDPMTVRGMSGGSIPGRYITGRSETPTGPCSGFFDEEPDHIIELTSQLDYLKLQVDSPEDTTLIVKGPGGSWCNDDLDGKNPGIVGEWLPGIYNVWIGSYKKEKYLPYTLHITKVK
ncbi:MAG: hypothetical protein SAK29_36850 [Scytonema sp. PMC 1069.18]|nr:hypothetical protein [Scytonema sp. PMC 1069.18]MEC4879856.1 hypothetical protein [Scytonema sp. PMC 1070.18]